ncbi:MAG: hypothetical protein J6574_03945 [Gilliamella sp.]|nr:hypothetical protein [Gilliamella sp.]
MAKNSVLNVFFDIETLTVNRRAKPAEHQVCEYVVACEYDYNSKHFQREYANLYFMIEDLLKLNKKKIKLIAHNGNRYDNHFIRRVLIDYYNLDIKNGYIRNAIDHKNESLVKKQHRDFMFEYRIKTKTDLALRFRIGKTTFVTEDSYPKFQASIKTIGKLLFHHEIIKNEDEEKLSYSYEQFDKKEKMTRRELRDYCMYVYKNLSEHDHKYIYNDTHLLYLAYKHYNDLFPGFDRTKMTLSQNILTIYKVNPIAELQLTNTYNKEKISYTEYNFDNEVLFDYIHYFYKGGLNFYNDKYVSKIVNNIVHIDLNSSYPTAMYYEKYPTFLIDANVVNKEIELNDNSYYFVKITKDDFNDIIKQIKSKQIRKMFVKYFNNKTNYVYLQTPHIKLIEKFIGSPILTIKAISFLEYKTEFFGARDVIKEYYSDKVNAKKKGLSYGEIYTKKVILNGIYGIPALRSHFNLFEWDYEDQKYINKINGFKNTERNLVFASAVTAYALKQLLTPLTKNAQEIDKGFIYCDTDSLFLTKEYYNTIVDNLELDDFKLGAWGVEHADIEKMYVLHHKKYCILTNDNIEVTAGGITADTFDTNMSFENFIETQFHEGAELSVKKNFYTDEGLITIYNAKTLLKSGGTYPDVFKKDSTFNYVLTLLSISKMEEEAEKNGERDGNTPLYYETPLGAISTSEVYPVEYDYTKTCELYDLIVYYSIINQNINNVSRETLR